MKKKLNDVWKVKEGTKTIWKLQAEKGILTFKRKKDALKWQKASEKNMYIKGGMNNEIFK